METINHIDFYLGKILGAKLSDLEVKEIKMHFSECKKCRQKYSKLIVRKSVVPSAHLSNFDEAVSIALAIETGKTNWDNLSQDEQNTLSHSFEHTSECEECCKTYYSIYNKMKIN